MVRPSKESDLVKPQSNFRRITKKINIKNPEIEEKYRNQATYASKTAEKNKQNISANANKKIHKKIMEEGIIKIEDLSSTPPSLKTIDAKSPKISVKLSNRSSNSETNNTNNSPTSFSTLSPVNVIIKGAKRTLSAIRGQKSRITQSKNKMPAVAKSEPMNRRSDKETHKKHKHKGKISSPAPPPESYFKPEGKCRTSSQPNKIIGRLITPKLVEEKYEKVEHEIKTKLVNRLEHSNVSLMTHYCIGLKSNHGLDKKSTGKHVKKLRKSKIPSRKIKKISISKSDLKNLGEDKCEKKYIHSKIIKSCASDDRQIPVREIKHNDSFVISAKKLQNSARQAKRPKPEIIRLFKRKDNSKTASDNSQLKSCLKKNPDGNPKQSFGEDSSKIYLPGPVKKVLKRSQIPRLSREKPFVK